MGIRTLSTREVYHNPWLRVREDRILRSNGAEGLYGVVDKEDCAIILPIDGDHVYLIEQFRYTIGRRSLEFPQGGWEMANVNAEELARGELREETGLLAGTMVPLGMQQIAYGFANQKQHVFLALDLSHGETDPDPEEHDLVLHRVPVKQLEQWMRDGTITDQCTFGAWAAYLLWQKMREHAG